MTETTYYPPESFELVFVDDDETAASINVTIEQSGGAALTLYGEFVNWAPEHSSVDEAIEWAREQVADRSGLIAETQVATVRSVDWPHGDRRVGFHEAGS